MAEKEPPDYALNPLFLKGNLSQQTAGQTVRTLSRLLRDQHNVPNLPRMSVPAGYLSNTLRVRHALALTAAGELVCDLHRPRYQRS